MGCPGSDTLLVYCGKTVVLTWLIVFCRDWWCASRSRCIFTTSAIWKCCTRSVTRRQTLPASALCRQITTTATWHIPAATRVAASRYLTLSTWLDRVTFAVNLKSQFSDYHAVIFCANTVEMFPTNERFREIFIFCCLYFVYF